jgi:hypothetical protein
VRAAPGPEPIREPEEVFLVDRAQHRSRGPLDDLDLKGCHSPIELHFYPISLWVRLR